MKKIGSIKRIGSLSPDKDFQDRVIIYSRGGGVTNIKGYRPQRPHKGYKKI